MLAVLERIHTKHHKQKIQKENSRRGFDEGRGVQMVDPIT